MIDIFFFLQPPLKLLLSFIVFDSPSEVFFIFSGEASALKRYQNIRLASLLDEKLVSLSSNRVLSYTLCTKYFIMTFMSFQNVEIFSKIVKEKSLSNEF